MMRLTGPVKKFIKVVGYIFLMMVLEKITGGLITIDKRK